MLGSFYVKEECIKNCIKLAYYAEKSMEVSLSVFISIECRTFSVGIFFVCLFTNWTNRENWVSFFFKHALLGNGEKDREEKNYKSC
jgi:hypothetical protein